MDKNTRNYLLRKHAETLIMYSLRPENTFRLVELVFIEHAFNDLGDVETSRLLKCKREQMVK